LLEKEYLQNAAEVGAYAKVCLKICLRHPSIGEVRGWG
jgi:4-aminobutyrate aminotransferase-like enzyme